MNRIRIFSFLMVIIGTMFIAFPAECRYYDPMIGRFLQRDPLGYFDSMNLYEYTFNNPVNFTDPFGLLGLDGGGLGLPVNSVNTSNVCKLSGSLDDRNFWEGARDYFSAELQKAKRPLTPEERRDLLEQIGVAAVTGGTGNVTKGLAANAKIIRAANKSLKEAQKLKSVKILKSIKVTPAKEPWWSKLLRLMHREELPKQHMKVPYVP